MNSKISFSFVMPGLDLPPPKRSSGFAQAGPGIQTNKDWMAGSRPAMTRKVNEPTVW